MSHWIAPTSKVPFTLLHELAKRPQYSSAGAIGMDLHAVVVDLSGVPYGVHIHPGQTKLIGCGIAMAIPRGYYGRVAPRSGLALKNSIDVLAGVIDSDYRGEIGVVLHNHGSNDFVVNTGDRIAQLIFERADRLTLVPASDKEFERLYTERGGAGYGSTGV